MNFKIRFILNGLTQDTHAESEVKNDLMGIEMLRPATGIGGEQSLRLTPTIVRVDRLCTGLDFFRDSRVVAWPKVNSGPVLVSAFQDEPTTLDVVQGATVRVRFRERVSTASVVSRCSITVQRGWCPKVC